MVDARTFQALSDPTRLKILSLLGGGSMNVSAMVARLGCTQPAVSRHLKVLKEAGLIVDERRGKWIEYSSNPRAVAEAAEFLRGFSDEMNAHGRAQRSTEKRPAARARAKPRKTARNEAGAKPVRQPSGEPEEPRYVITGDDRNDDLIF
jgi:DNA-binding transcriptional ArsR family regulator